MLVFSRKRDESSVICHPETGEPLAVVTILEIRGDKVRIGFQAEKDTLIYRWEIWEKIQPAPEFAASESISA